MVELKTPLPLLTLTGLRDLSATQKGLQSQVTSAIADATTRIAKIRKDAASGPDKTALGESRKIGATTVTMLTAADKAAIASVRSVANRQSIRLISDVREATDTVVVPLLKTMQQNANSAKEYSERHWDIGSILRRAKGASTGTSGLAEAMSLRESYTAILTAAHSLELAKWGQAALSAIVQSYDVALSAYGAFGREIGAASLRRISMGLPYPDLKLNDDGSISTSALQGA